MDPAGARSDLAAASDSRLRQIQAVAARRADALARMSAGLQNTVFGRLPVVAAALAEIAQFNPAELVERLGDAYDLSSELAMFIDIDQRVRDGLEPGEVPLPGEVHAALNLAVQIKASWLHGLPTVAGWQDAAGKARAQPVAPAHTRSMFRVARNRKAITAADFATMERLGAATAAGHQADKVRHRVEDGAKNLLLDLATARTAEQAGILAPDDLVGRLLAERALATLQGAKDDVAAFARRMPAGLGPMLLGLAAGLNPPPLQSQAEPESSDPEPDPPMPDDVEAQARALILAGQAPPPGWKLHIHKLDFSATIEERQKFKSGGVPPPQGTAAAFHRTDLLAGLTSLQSLDLRNTQVSDLAPIAGLNSLQSLDLDSTRVSDLAPIAGLDRLQSLDLWDTLVSDLAPIAGFASLQSLNLTATKVSDLAPIAGLTSLQSLNLSYTRVSDLAPIAGLTSLQWLGLRYTQVSDLAAVEALRRRGVKVHSSATSPKPALKPLATIYQATSMIARIGSSVRRFLTRP